MKNISLLELVKAVDGTLLGTCEQGVVTGVSTDSRTVGENDVFFALQGERFDAHDFLPQIASGAGFVISKELSDYQSDKFYILVRDTHLALGQFARYYLSLFDIPVIAVTGSVGKTTAKDMITSVLSAKYQVHKTQGNFNNTIGLPLTIFQLMPEHECCVLEMGMDTAGEISYMGNIACPDVAVITNIGDAHIQRLGSREGIRQAKLEILPFLSTEGVLMVNGDDQFLLDGLPKKTAPLLTVGYASHCSYSGTVVDSDGVTGISVDVQSPQGQFTLSVPALGEHMIYPTLFAVALGEKYGLSQSEIQNGLSAFVPSKMRMNVSKLPRGITLLNDTYNANPQSVKAGLEVLAHYTGEKKIAVLGDMLELGGFSEELHRNIGEVVVQEQIDVLVTIGTEAKAIAHRAIDLGMKEVYHFQENPSAGEKINALLTDHTTVLFKASRGMALDELVLFVEEALQE